MIILGVDPGTIYAGVGIIDCSQTNCLSYIYSSCITLGNKLPLPEKLKILYDEISKLMKAYKPDEFAIETAFYGKNIQSALKIGYARGVSILAATHNNLPVNEYSPKEVKKSVTGKGSASKEQVSYMVSVLLNLQNNSKTKFDETDALAISVCHAFNRNNTSTGKTKNWKAFIEANPDKIIQG